jgi:guanine nucleotide-binding protein alpha-1 subunit
MYRCSFLDDLDRIATPTYEPSDDDVLRARLRTLGVQEHSLSLDQTVDEGPSSRTHYSGFFLVSCLTEILVGADYGRDWIMYDVGGARTSVCTFQIIIQFKI